MSNSVSKTKNSIQLGLLYSCCFLLLFALYLHLFSYIGDDDTILTAGGATPWKLFISRWNAGGRCFCDSFGGIFLGTSKYFFIFFCVINWLWISYSICKEFDIVDVQGHLFTQIVLFTIPLSYFSSGGWIMTTAGYLFPFSLLLGCIRIVHIYISSPKHRKIFLFIPFILFSIYICNQDQYAIFECIWLLGILIQSLYKRDGKHNCILIFLGLTIAIFIFDFFIPGHIQRIGDAESWIPGYSNWNIFTKIFHGYTSSVAGLFYNHLQIVLLLILLLALHAFIDGRKAIAYIMAAFFVLLQILNYNVIKDGVCMNMPELVSVDESITLSSGMLILFSIVICGSILFAFSKQKNADNNFCIFFFLTAGILRVMIGFANSMYASLYRTYIPSIFIVAMLCIHEYRFIKVKPRYALLAVGLYGAVINICNVM